MPVQFCEHRRLLRQALPVQRQQVDYCGLGRDEDRARESEQASKQESKKAGKQARREGGRERERERESEKRRFNRRRFQLPQL